MSRHFLVEFLSVWLLVGCINISIGDDKSSEENYGPDVFLDWNPWLHRPGERVVISLNEKKVADGAAGMREVLHRVRQMPAGSHLVMGPNPQFFMSGPPRSKPTVPTEYPELWQELIRTAKDREVSTSWLGYYTRHKVQDPHAFYLVSERDETKNKTIPTLDIQWRNYPFKDTPHQQVVYLINGKYAGMGNDGFTTILSRVDNHHRGGKLIYNEYSVHNQVSIDDSLRERLAKTVILPFATRKNEFDQLVSKNQLKVQRLRQIYWPKPPYDDRIDEEQPLAFYNSLLRVSTIIRDGRKPAPAKISLSWQWKRPVDEFGRLQTSVDMTESATYFINDEPIGTGTAGFLAAVEKIKNCQEGDAIRIDPMCIRTKGPFKCVMIADRHRHFETTGIEPFQGLVDVLVDTVERNKLLVELIPDEGEANRRANLNR